MIDVCPNTVTKMYAVLFVHPFCNYLHSLDASFCKQCLIPGRLEQISSC